MAVSALLLGLLDRRLPARHPARVTAGSIGDAGRSFITDLRQADSASLQSAFAGGVIFNLSNILLVAAIDIAGMAVAFPIGVGLALVLGVITNYLAAPVGNAALLFLGVSGVVLAILFSAAAYRRLSVAWGEDEREGDRAVAGGRPAHGLLLPFRRRVDVRRLRAPGRGQARSRTPRS